MAELELLDTTIRDGELSPAFNPDPGQRMQIARALDAAGVDIIEIASSADSEQRLGESKRIARSLEHARACCISEIGDRHIEIARAVLDGAREPRIHLYLDARRVHRLAAGGGEKKDILDQVSAAIRNARNHFPEVQFSPQDATRADRASLFELAGAAIEAGAQVINISDTTGSATPALIEQLFSGLSNAVEESAETRLSLHAHNHEGRAVDNLCTAIGHGASQVEGTINGVGPAGGNTDLIEVVDRLGETACARLRADCNKLRLLAKLPVFS
jgi:2-isopropylmalate synthase